LASRHAELARSDTGMAALSCCLWLTQLTSFALSRQKRMCAKVGAASEYVHALSMYTLHTCMHLGRLGERGAGPLRDDEAAPGQMQNLERRVDVHGCPCCLGCYCGFCI
jgi:hypothetical protein